MAYFLGVDIGATKTHALIADETGRALALGRGGAGNPESVGWEGLAKAIEIAQADAVSQLGIGIEAISGAGFGIGGYDWASERDPILETIRGTGLTCPVQAVNDAVIGLIAGASEGWGIAVISGTGCNCYGRDRGGRVGRVTGEGWAMGEAAGAGELVEEAVRQVARAWSRRGPRTGLTSAFMSLTGARSEEDLLEGLCENRYFIDASAAPIVFQLAREGDAVARATIEWAGRQLGELAIGVIRQLEFEREQFEVVLTGSMFDGGPMLIDPLCESVHGVAPGARFVRLAAPPVVGAVLLGMEAADLREPGVRERLIGGARKLSI